MHDSWEVQGLDLSVVASDVRLIWKSEIDVLEILGNCWTCSHHLQHSPKYCSARWIIAEVSVVVVPNPCKLIVFQHWGPLSWYQYCWWYHSLWGYVVLEGLCIDHQNPTVHVECEGAQNGFGPSPCLHPQFPSPFWRKFGTRNSAGNYHICVIGDNNAGFVTFLETIKDMHGYSETCLLNRGVQVPHVMFRTVVNLSMHSWLSMLGCSWPFDDWLRTWLLQSHFVVAWRSKRFHVLWKWCCICYRAHEYRLGRNG